MSDIQFISFESNGKEGLAVGLPADSFGFDVDAGVLHYQRMDKSPFPNTGFVPLPSGSWSILGRLNGLAEELLKELYDGIAVKYTEGIIYTIEKYLERQSDKPVTISNPLILIKK